MLRWGGQVMPPPTTWFLSVFFLAHFHWLAGRADVAAGAAGLDLDHRRAARQAGLPFTVTDQQKTIVPAAPFSVQVQFPRAATLVNIDNTRLL